MMMTYGKGKRRRVWRRDVFASLTAMRIGLNVNASRAQQQKQKRRVILRVKMII